MKTMPVSEFKAHALKVVTETSETREPVTITKRGKPVAQLIPFPETEQVPDRLADLLLFEEDIVSPLGEEMWEACR